MKGYKATDSNGKCRDVSFKVGKTYTIKSEMKMCSSGFHFCQNFFDVYSYYDKNETTRIFEVEALGEVLTEGDKSCTSKIKILREIVDKELLGLWIKKTNSGDWNSGDWNSGNRNSGDGNSGNRNSGDGNSGDWNSGNRNSGDGNSGYGNSGNRNSGDWNSGDGNSGYFNTVETPLILFNKPSVLKYTKDIENKMRALNVKPILTWISTSGMTEEEKTNFPSHKTTGGFLKKTDRYDWSTLTDEDKKFITALPNFDDEIFEKITGIRLLTPKKIKVIIEDVEYEVEAEALKKLTKKEDSK